jgi:hypothetical protein
LYHLTGDIFTHVETLTIYNNIKVVRKFLTMFMSRHSRIITIKYSDSKIIYIILFSGRGNLSIFVNLNCCPTLRVAINGNNCAITV